MDAVRGYPCHGAVVHRQRHKLKKQKSNKMFNKPDWKLPNGDLWLNDKCISVADFFRQFETKCFSEDPNRWYEHLLKRIGRTLHGSDHVALGPS
eukprot:COSAG04_NODE_632_length_11728_cov_15.952532_6_plen_94_part_00